MSKTGRDISTLKGLIDEYIEVEAKPKKTCWHEDLRVLNKDVLPKWKFKKVEEITERDIQKLLEKLSTQVSPAVANKALKVLQKVFRFTLSQNILKTNPCAKISEPDTGPAKDRILKESDIRKIWFGLEKAKMTEATKLALKFLLVTGQRNGEVAGAKWKEIDLMKKCWTISGERTKNKNNHRVYLTQMAVDILKEAKKNLRKTDCIFPNRKDGHLTSRSITGAIKNNSENISQGQPKNKPPFGDVFNIEPFAPNDLRRAMSTLMPEVDELQIAKAQNNGTSTPKNRNAEDIEKRQTLVAWERKLQNILFSWRKVSPRKDSKERYKKK